MRAKHTFQALAATRHIYVFLWLELKQKTAPQTPGWRRFPVRDEAGALISAIGGSSIPCAQQSEIVPHAAFSSMKFW